MGSFAEMSYRIDRHISTKGTRLQSYQIVPFERLVARFGEPRAGDGVSTIYQWVFSDDGGNVYTLYDWKATTMYKRDLVTPAKLRDLPEYKWHIGATPGITTNHFKAWIQDETLAKSPDVNVKRRELLNASFYKYDCDQLGFLEAAQMRAFIRKMATKFRREITGDFIEDSMRNFCEIDANGHGKVYQAEFVNYFLTQYEEVPEETFLEALYQCTALSGTADTALRSLFWRLDHDGTGYCSVDTLNHVAESLARECGVVLPPAEELNAHVSHFMNAAEGNMLSEEEFLTVLFEIFGEVNQAVFLPAVGYEQLPYAGSRETVLANFFQRHNRETMQAEEMRNVLLRLGSWKNGMSADQNPSSLDTESVGAARLQEPNDDEVLAQLATFSGVDNNGDGMITEEEFVTFLISETERMRDIDFFTLMQFLWHGTLSFY